MNLNRGILAIQLQGNLPIFDKSKWVGEIAKKTERKKILFLRGTLGDTQYHNTVRKIGKYRNTGTVSKIDEIPNSIYDRSRLLKAVSILRACLPQACMHLKSTSDFARKREKTLIYKDRKARSLDALSISS